MHWLVLVISHVQICYSRGHEISKMERVRLLGSMNVLVKWLGNQPITFRDVLCSRQMFGQRVALDGRSFKRECHEINMRSSKLTGFINSLDGWISVDFRMASPTTSDTAIKGQPIESVDVYKYLDVMLEYTVRRQQCFSRRGTCVVNSGLFVFYRVFYT